MIDGNTHDQNITPTAEESENPIMVMGMAAGVGMDATDNLIPKLRHRIVGIGSNERIQVATFIHDGHTQHLQEETKG